MTHTYYVAGMTCNNCKKSVEDALRKLDQVSKAEVNLKAEEVTISMDFHIETQVLKDALPDKYMLTEKLQKNVFKSAESKEDKSTIKQLFPLFLILGYITIASILLNMNPIEWHGFMLDFMGLFYIVFSFFKLLDLKGFPESFRMYDPLAKAIPAYGWLYPFIEVTLGILFLMRFQITLALVLTIIVLGVTTFGVTKTLLDKKAIQCACLGTALKLPMTKATFIENTIMLIMAISMLIKTLYV
jgi:cation transport ATPase